MTCFTDTRVNYADWLKTVSYVFKTGVKSKEASGGTMWEALLWEGKPGYHTIMWYNTLKLSGLWHHDPT